MLYINPAARISLGWDRPTIHDTFALATGLDSSNATSCDAVVLATSLDSSNAATCDAFVLATGLDSSNAARVVDILAGLAAAGVTVIITIHQPRPDVFNLMQRVMILSGDGRLVYSGAACSFSIPSAHSTQHTLCTLLLSILDVYFPLLSVTPPPFPPPPPPPFPPAPLTFSSPFCQPPPPPFPPPPCFVWGAPCVLRYAQASHLLEFSLPVMIWGSSIACAVLHVVRVLLHSYQVQLQGS